jgi:hypothetical protein
MTVADLIADLQDLPQDAPVHIAIQPTYPLACEIAAVTLLEDGEDDEYGVWLAAGEATGYTTSDCWQ